MLELVRSMELVLVRSMVLELVRSKQELVLARSKQELAHSKLELVHSTWQQRDVPSSERTNHHRSVELEHSKLAHKREQVLVRSKLAQVHSNPS